jgi:hypothetical protein
MSQSPKILVSIVAYREKYLGQSVKSCIDSAKYPENIYFSIVSEQGRPELHANLDFIDPDKIIYRKYDLSEYRGVLWSRSKTTEVTFNYDYILYTCGHNLFAPNWDVETVEDLTKAKILTEKPILVSSGPEYEYNLDGTIKYDTWTKRTTPAYRPKISLKYVPGYGFPNELQIEVPGGQEVLPDTYIQFSWVFADKKFIEEVPLDPNMGFHAEEISTTVRAWARGWRVFSSQKILYYHDTHKQYPGEELSRTISHRPWADLNKKEYWKQSDETLTRLNLLLSGNLAGKYGGVTKNQCIAFCEYTGMNKKWCELIENYNKLFPGKRHGEKFRDDSPIILDF